MSVHVEDHKAIVRAHRFWAGTVQDAMKAAMLWVTSNDIRVWDLTATEDGAHENCVVVVYQFVGIADDVLK